MAIERFDDFVNRCLYSPDTGFYTSGNSTAGRRGAFITSPEVGPLFGAVLANKIQDVWVKAGSPSEFKVFDVGSNSGAFLRSLQLADVAVKDFWSLVSVDYSDADLTPDEFQQTDLTNSIVIANELLDNLPFRMFSKTEAGFEEVWVQTENDQSEYVSKPLSEAEICELPDQIKVVLENLDLGTESRVPVLDSANSWIQNVLDRNPASLLIFDYGTKSTQELVTRGDWLRTYQHHIRGENPLELQGKLDITTDIALDQLPKLATVLTQCEFLKLWGIEQLAVDGNNYWLAHAAKPDLTSMRMRSRTSEALSLQDPKGLGSWLVAEWL